GRRPHHHVVVLVVVWIPDRFEKLAVAPWPTHVLRRATSGSFNQTRIGDPRKWVGHPLDPSIIDEGLLFLAGRERVYDDRQQSLFREGVVQRELLPCAQGTRGPARRASHPAREQLLHDNGYILLEQAKRIATCRFTFHSERDNGTWRPLRRHRRTDGRRARRPRGAR